jgi:hypothetical protein
MEYLRRVLEESKTTGRWGPSRTLKEDLWVRTKFLMWVLGVFWALWFFAHLMGVAGVPTHDGFVLVG